MDIPKVSKVLESLQSQIDYGNTKQLTLALHNAEALIERDSNSITVKIIKNEAQPA